MRPGDTIVAWASAPTRSTRAIIRISGCGTQALLSRVLESPPHPPRAHPARLILRDHLTLPVLVLRYIAPASYTGEDAAEILLPGNPALIERVLARLTQTDGVVLAGPGEFTARAFLAGKMTLEQAEGVAHLIAAQTQAQMTAAHELMAGRAGAVHRAWAEELASILSLVEAGIDFTDQEDVVAISPDDVRTRAEALLDAMRTHLGAEAGRASGDAMPRVALVGPPSAGKSTLFNALLGRRRAMVDEAPGTTRDVLVEELDLSHESPGAGAIALMDLPGLDASATTTIGRESQRLAHHALANADVLVQCDPAGRFAPITANDTQRIIRVRTKADLAVTTRDDDALAVCGLDGWGLASLRRAIADVAFAGECGASAAMIPRHRRALRDVTEHLAIARDNADAPELAAEALRRALDALGELTGHLSPDDIIGRIFATFCIGK